MFTDLLERGAEAGEFDVGDVSVIRNSMLSSCARIYFWYRPEGRYGPAELADLISDHLVAAVAGGARTRRSG
jgi:hypothetical protein